MGWPDEDASMFRECIRAMDAVYMAHVNKAGNDEQPVPEGSDNPARDAVRGILRGGKR